jgi:hypothetical protein
VEGARCRMRVRWRCGHMWSMMWNRVDMMQGYMQRIPDITFHPFVPRGMQTSSISSRPPMSSGVYM